MNRCEDRHEKRYKITYKPAKGGEYTPTWLVCEHCMEKHCFGDEDLIKTVEILV